MQPACLQLLTVEVNSPDIGIGIVATTEDAAWTLVRTSQIGSGSQIALTTVTIVALVVLTATVIPVKCACSLTQFCLGITVRPVGNGMDSLTSLTLEDGQIFMTAIDATGTATPVLGIAGSLDFLVGGSLIHIIAFTVFRAGSRLTHQLGFAVAVVIIDLKLCVVRTGTDIHTQINAPEFGAIEFIAIQKDIVSLVTLRVVFRVTWIPLDNDFVCSVTIDIAYGTVVGRVGATQCACCRTIQLQLFIECVPTLDSLRGLFNLPIDFYYNLVFGVLGAIPVNGPILIVGYFQVSCYRFAITNQVEYGIGIIRSQQAPTDKTAYTIL